MEDFYFSVNLDGERTLCLAPLTDRRISMADQEIADPSGHFLYEKHGSGETAKIEIIARVTSPEAVWRLRDMFNMA